MKPAIAIVRLDATPVSVASNTLIRSARAKISLRIAPGDHPQEALDRLAEPLRKHLPWNAQLTFSAGEFAEAVEIETDNPVFDVAREALRVAWDGAEPVDIGGGGSIPLVAGFRKFFPNAAILVTGVEDPAMPVSVKP